MEPMTCPILWRPPGEQKVLWCTTESKKEIMLTWHED